MLELECTSSDGCGSSTLFSDPSDEIGLIPSAECAIPTKHDQQESIFYDVKLKNRETHHTPASMTILFKDARVE